MKILPPPYVPGKTESERFDNAMRKILSTPRGKIASGKKALCPKPPTKSKPISHVPLPFAEAMKPKPKKTTH